MKTKYDLLVFLFSFVVTIAGLFLLSYRFDTKEEMVVRKLERKLERKVEKMTIGEKLSFMDSVVLAKGLDKWKKYRGITSDYSDGKIEGILYDFCRLLEDGNYLGAQFFNFNSKEGTELDRELIILHVVDNFLPLLPQSGLYRIGDQVSQVEGNGPIAMILAEKISSFHLNALRSDTLDQKEIEATIGLVYRQEFYPFDTLKEIRKECFNKACDSLLFKLLVGEIAGGKAPEAISLLLNEAGKRWGSPIQNAGAEIAKKRARRTNSDFSSYDSEYKSFVSRIILGNENNDKSSKVYTPSRLKEEVQTFITGI
jgi:hypothetical protein